MSVTELQDPKTADLEAYAAEQGIDLPKGLGSIVATTAYIAMAEQLKAAQEDHPGGPSVPPAPVDEDEEDLGDGCVRVTRKVLFVNERGDWRNPWTGQLVWCGQTVDPCDPPGMHVDEHATAHVPTNRRKRRTPEDVTYTPVNVGDEVTLIREDF